MSILALASRVSRSNPNCRVSPSSPAHIDNCFPKWVCSQCEGKTVWITSSDMDLQRVACLRPLCYKIPTKVSQFSVLTVPFPRAGCECPAFEIAMDWHLAAALGGKQPFRQGTSWGEGWGRNVDLLRNPHSPAYLKKKSFILSFQASSKCAHFEIQISDGLR